MMKRAVLAALLLAAPTPALRAQIVVVSNTVSEQAAAPGQSYAGTLRLRNPDGVAHEARLYLRDYTFSADGRTDYPAPGTLHRSSARWVTVSPAQVRLGPGEEATVGYTVAVPADPGLTGTYWSLLMVEGVAPPAAAPDGRGRVQVGITPTIRYGVQLATTIEGTGSAEVRFVAARAFADSTGKVLELEVANSGTLAYRPELRVELFDAAGNRAGTFTSRRGLVYPGASIRQRFELGRLPAGEYQAMVVGDAGGAELFGANYRLRL